MVSVTALTQDCSSVDGVWEVCWIWFGIGLYPENTKHFNNIYTTSAQRLRRWSTIVYMFYKYCCACWVDRFEFRRIYLHIKHMLYLRLCDYLVNADTEY